MQLIRWRQRAPGDASQTKCSDKVEFGKMINAIVYSRTSTVKLVRIPHPTFNSKSIFGSDRDCFPVGVGGTVTYLMINVIKKVMDVLTPIWKRAPLNRQWVTVRVHSAGVNPVDAKFLYGDKLPRFLIYFFRFFIENRTCGIDFSGEVSDAPPNCEFKVGDQVFGTMAYPAYGSFAEYARARTDSISLKPRNLSHAQASALPLAGLTAIQAMEDSHLQRGMHILIIGGSGGTGHIALQVAKLKGMKVTAICSSRNAIFVKNLGADAVISYDKTENLPEDIAHAVECMGSFDMVYDTVSSNDARDALHQYEHTIRHSSYPLMVPGSEGKYVRLGGSPSDWLLAHVKRFFGVNFFQRNRELFWVRFEDTSLQLKELRDYVESGKLEPTVSKHLPFTQLGVQEAFIHQLNRRTVGKMVVDIIPEICDK